LSFALNFDFTRCLSLDTAQTNFNVQYCFQYNSAGTCIRCNNYDPLRPTSTYYETIGGQRGVFALVANETTPWRQCQFMRYCQAANKIAKSTLDSKNNI